MCHVERKVRNDKKRGRLKEHIFLLILVQFGSYITLFDIAGETQYTYIVSKRKKIILAAKQKKLPKGSPFYLFIQRVKINTVFTDNLHILYIKLIEINSISDLSVIFGFWFSNLHVYITSM